MQSNFLESRKDRWSFWIFVEGLSTWTCWLPSASLLSCLKFGHPRRIETNYAHDTPLIFSCLFFDEDLTFKRQVPHLECPVLSTTKTNTMVLLLNIMKKWFENPAPGDPWCDYIHGLITNFVYTTTSQPFCYLVETPPLIASLSAYRPTVQARQVESVICWEVYECQIIWLGAENLTDVTSSQHWIAIRKTR